MKKKLTALSLLFVMLFSFASCTKSGTVLEVSDVYINSGVFTYYLDKVMSSPKKYGVKEESKENCIAAAETLCKKYAVTESFMKENGIALSTQRKQAVASEVEALWSLYSAYYESVGVMKTDITKVITHEYRMKELVDYYFGTKGKKPVSEDDLKEEFVDIYVGFKVVAADLTRINDTGEKVSLTESEKESLRKKFRTYAEKINSGNISIDDANVRYNDSLGLITTENLETILVKKGDAMYSDGFFEKIFSISHGRATVIEDGKNLYLVQREKIATTDEDAFSQYRTQVLEEIKMPEVEKKINGLVKKAESDIRKGRAEKIYEKISEVKSAE